MSKSNSNYVRVPVGPEAVYYFKRLPRDPLKIEFGGTMKLKDKRLRIANIASGNFANVNIQKHTSFQWHTHVAHCRAIHSRRSQKHKHKRKATQMEECAMFVPSSTDIELCLKDVGNIAHLIITKHGVFVLHRWLCKPKYKVSEVADILDDFVDKFRDGIDNEKRFCRNWLAKATRLGLSIDFIPSSDLFSKGIYVKVPI